MYQTGLMTTPKETTINEMEWKDLLSTTTLESNFPSSTATTTSDTMITDYEFGCDKDISDYGLRATSERSDELNTPPATEDLINPFLSNSSEFFDFGMATDQADLMMDAGCETVFEGNVEVMQDVWGLGSFGAELAAANDSPTPPLHASTEQEPPPTSAAAAQSHALQIVNVPVAMVATSTSSSAAPLVNAFMVPVDPIEVCGVKIIPAVPVVAATSNPKANIAPLNLRAAQMAQQHETPPDVGLSTPTVEESIGEQFDNLVDMVLDDGIGVDDPFFMGCRLLSSPPPVDIEHDDEEVKDENSATIKPKTEEKPATRERGRPRLPRTTDIPKKPRGRPPGSRSARPSAASASDSGGPGCSTDHMYMSGSASALSDDDAKEAKYRRMRDLNNEASKRCRQRRKNTMSSLEDEERELRARHADLRVKHRAIKGIVAELKKRFLHTVANGSVAGAPASSAELFARAEQILNG